MNTEFKAIALDYIRYSLVWEDSETLYNTLKINKFDDLLIITSAGCNVLNALIKKPRSVTAIDLNPMQNRLLKLKRHLILNHSFKTYLALNGFLGDKALEESLRKLQNTLDGEENIFWTEYFKINYKGIVGSGRLESYITSFLNTLNQSTKDKLSELLTFECVVKQANYFVNHLDRSEFKSAFINYFDDKNLSKGRDPKLSIYAEESGGQAFYNRLVNQIKHTLIRDNFYFRFFFFGPKNIPQHILPPCYQQQNFSKLQQNIHLLNIIDGEAIEYLSSEEGSKINKASLSNIFEYTSLSEFQLVCNTMAERIKQPLHILFWNLLNSQADERLIKPKSVTVKMEETQASACFYFKNVKSLNFNY